jgi:hypothetical protein
MLPVTVLCSSFKDFQVEIHNFENFFKLYFKISLQYDKKQIIFLHYKQNFLTKCVGTIIPPNLAINPFYNLYDHRP